MNIFRKTTPAAVLATVATLCTPAFAQEVDGSLFRASEEGNWYHPIEPDMWVSVGGDRAVLDSVIGRISSAKGTRSTPDQPDTITAFGDGNWMYEFLAAGDDAMARAQSASGEANQYAAYREAIVYYHIAGAPFQNTEANLDALDRSGKAYAKAATLLPGTFQSAKIPHDGRTFEAYLHLPTGAGPHPILVMSNGSDQSKETALGYFETELGPKGIGLLSLDMPGLGDSNAYTSADGKTEKLHVAAINWAKAHPSVDAQNIFVQGASFGGNAAARVFLGHPDLDLGGVAYVCGPVHQPFLAPPEVYASFPVFTIDGVKARMDLEPDASFEQLAEAVRVLSLEGHGLFSGEKIDTPLLAINTNRDPVASIDDMNLVLARANDARTIIFDMEGHCPPHDAREAIISSWILTKLR